MTDHPTQQVQVTPRTEPQTQAGRETHTLLHRLSTQMKTCEMVPCPFSGLARRTEIEGAGAARSVPVAEGLQEALEHGMAYALARAALPSTTETSIEYAERLAPLVIESGFLAATPPDPAEGQEPAVPPATAEHGICRRCGTEYEGERKCPGSNFSLWCAGPPATAEAPSTEAVELLRRPEEPAVIDVERLAAALHEAPISGWGHDFPDPTCHSCHQRADDIANRYGRLSLNEGSGARQKGAGEPE